MNSAAKRPLEWLADAWTPVPQRLGSRMATAKNGVKRSFFFLDQVTRCHHEFSGLTEKPVV
jgi:hypothetical protein